jgi:eukaryotic-like serine/threonine-protein kinase
MPAANPDVTGQTRIRREESIEGFETAWRQGLRPRIEEFLPRNEADRQAVLIELIHVDSELRRKAGEEAHVEEYLARFPELADDAAVVESIRAEFARGAVAAASASSPKELPSIPGFNLIGEIGRGGMGVVFRAHDISLDREVALKFLQERYAADSPAGRRFVEEARITGQLQHPGIPAIHQVGMLPDGRPYTEAPNTRFARVGR